MSESTNRKSLREIIIVVAFEFNPRDKSELQRDDVLVRNLNFYFKSNKCQVMKCFYFR